MSTQKQHIIILPYYCQDEISRYVKIADHLRSYPKQKSNVCFLLASSPSTPASDELYDAYSSLGPTVQYQCPTRIFGYPEGPTAMYWDCMDFIADEFKGQSGFSLWMESDMCPIKSNWLDRLSKEWFSRNNDPLMMGCYVPEVYKHRFFRKPKLILEPHVNGGACYSVDFASRMPRESRHGVFDMAVYKHASRIGNVIQTDQIAFSTTSRVRRDLLDDRKCILHGFMQDKNKFISDCIRPLTPREKTAASLAPIKDQIETMRRRLRVCFVRKGHRAMLENMLLAKQKMESQRKAA